MPQYFCKNNNCKGNLFQESENEHFRGRGLANQIHHVPVVIYTSKEQIASRHMYLYVHGPTYKSTTRSEFP